MTKTLYLLQSHKFNNENIQATLVCPKCKEAGFQVKLGPKILMPGEKATPDYNSWLQCTSCAEIVAAYIVEHDATIIRDDIPTVDNPFENTSEIMGAVAKRSTKAGKRASAKRDKERYRPHHKDADIDREMQRHGDRVNVIYDSNP
jgi:hypothetical protein